eukprot:Skav224962  [mRNA]  locus=scaffold2811:5582:7589:- [translate_table: standard]
MVMVVLKPIYHEMKQLPGKDKGTWWKAIIRLVDQKGQGLYAEVRGGSEAKVRKRAQEFYQPKCLGLTQVTVTQNTTFLCGFSADVTNAGKLMPVADAHPSAIGMRGAFPVAKSNFGVLNEHAQGKERADLIGKVTNKETPQMKTPKMTLGLKDESGQELAVHLWGGRFVSRGKDVALGDIVQVDNALLSKIPAGIEASCEHWQDSNRNWFSALHVNPIGPRVEKLRALDDGRGEALSVPWLQTASRRMAQSGIIEVQLNNVWVTGILGDPMYIACKHCATKVDPETGFCKRHESQNCQTMREEEASILATVTLADHTGEIERVLVDGEQLQQLANTKSKQELLKLLARHGSQAVCFRHPVDIRLATNGRKTGGGRSNVPAAAHGVLQAQEHESAMEILPDCQFQVLASQPALCATYSDASRPMIRKIVRVENQRATGMVFPIACPHEDLLFSSFGTKLRSAPIFPSYVTLLVRAEDEEPKIVETGSGDDKVIMLQYEKVVALEADPRKHFRMEAFCQLAQTIHFNMCDEKVHLVIGKVTAGDDGADLVLVAERVFKLNTEEQVQALQAERVGIAAAEMISSKKRHAGELVKETPAKRKSAAWH